jgi:hypothetical protein
VGRLLQEEERRGKCAAETKVKVIVDNIKLWVNIL